MLLKIRPQHLAVLAAGIALSAFLQLAFPQHFTNSAISCQPQENPVEINSNNHAEKNFEHNEYHIVAPPPESDPNLQTRIKCTRWPDFTDSCYYEDVCWDGDKIVFLTQDLRRDFSELKPIRSEFSFETEHFDLQTGPPPYATELPVDSRLNGYYRHTSALNAPYGQGKVAVDWSNKTIVFVIPDIDRNNRWHFTTTWMPLSLLRRQALGWTKYNRLESNIDHVILRRNYDDGFSEWERTMRKWVIGEADVIYQRANLWPSPVKLQCFEKAWTFSPRARIFQGPEECFNFRKMAYNESGIDPAIGWTLPPPQRVLIVNRANTTSRHIENTGAMLEACVRLNLTCDVQDIQFGTIQEHVRLFSQYGVFVFTHGDAASSAMFLPSHAAVIEIFPTLYAPNAYTQMIEQCGYFHLRLYEQLPKKIEHPTNEDITKKCVGKSRLEITQDKECLELYRKASVLVDVGAFERALQNAMQDIGYTTRMPGYLTALVPSDDPNDRSRNPWTLLNKNDKTPMPDQLPTTP